VTDSRDRLRRLALSVVGRFIRPVSSRVGAFRSSPGRLLLIRPDHFGDVLLVSPAAAYLRQAFPDSHVSLLVGPWSEAVARRGLEVDEVLTCDFPGFTRRPKRHLLEPYQLLVREATRLRDCYDLAVVFRPDHWWGALLAAAARVPLRLGWDTPTTRPLLTDLLPLSPGVHATVLNMMLAERASQLADGACRKQGGRTEPRLIFRLTDEERAWPTDLLSRDNKPFVLLHPGSGSALKNWPPTRWAAVADALSESGVVVAITGGPDDRETPRQVAAAAQSSPLLLAGKTSLGQLGALAERCVLALGTDSGPLHLATALGVPTLRLYGPTDEAVFGPPRPDTQHLVLTNPLPCRPCGNIVSPPCGAHQEPPCMLGIETERVVEAVLATLKRVQSEMTAGPRVV
jgi:lipopolysaccharide heptosyltransferase II